MQSFRRRLIVMPAILLGLVCLMGADPEPMKPLRYSGKTFEEWRDGLHAELNPEARAAGIKALIAFGQNGKATEAMAIILELVGPYDWNDEDIKPIKEAALRAAKLGRPVIPQLVEALGSDKPGTHALAKDILLYSRVSEAIPAGLKAEKPLLIRAARRGNAQTVETLLPILCSIDPGAITAALVLELLDSRNAKIRAIALKSLSALKPGIEARILNPMLIRLLQDDDKDVRFWTVIQLPRKDVAPEVVPLLCKLLKSGQLGDYGEVNAYEVLGAAGPAAKEAIPVLKFKWESYKKDSSGRELSYEKGKSAREALFKALQKIDPMEAQRLPGRPLQALPLGEVQP